jgi:hypothetical protein
LLSLFTPPESLSSSLSAVIERQSPLLSPPALATAAADACSSSRRRDRSSYGNVYNAAAARLFFVGGYSL